MTMAPGGRLAVCLHSEQEVWGQWFPTDNKEEWEHVHSNANKSEKKKALFSLLRIAWLTGQTGCANLCHVCSAITPLCDKGSRTLTWWCTPFFRLALVTVNMWHFCTETSETNQPFVVYCVKLYTFTIPNASHSLQTERKFLVLIKVMAHFIWPLAANFRERVWEWGRKSWNVTKHNMNTFLEHFLVGAHFESGQLSFLFIYFFYQCRWLFEWRQQLP